LRFLQNCPSKTGFSKVDIVSEGLKNASWKQNPVVLFNICDIKSNYKVWERLASHRWWTHPVDNIEKVSLKNYMFSYLNKSFI